MVGPNGKSTKPVGPQWQKFKYNTALLAKVLVAALVAKKTKTDKQVSQYIPSLGLSLAKYSGDQLIERVGEDIIKNVVTSILCGGNVRALTEGLTQRRISLSNASLLIGMIKVSIEFM